MIGLGRVSGGWEECHYDGDSNGDDAVRDAEISNEGEYLEDKWTVTVACGQSPERKIRYDEVE